jgi:hypothetical protein
LHVAVRRALLCEHGWPQDGAQPTVSELISHVLDCLEYVCARDIAACEGAAGEALRAAGEGDSASEGGSASDACSVAEYDSVSACGSEEEEAGRERAQEQLWGQLEQAGLTGLGLQAGLLDARMLEERRERQQEEQRQQDQQQTQQQQHTEQSVCDSAIFTSPRAPAPAMESNGVVTGSGWAGLGRYLPLGTLCSSSRLTAAAHASFSHAEHAIAAVLDDEGLGEDEGEDGEDPEDTDMRDTQLCGRLAPIGTRDVSERRRWTGRDATHERMSAVNTCVCRYS